jgi:hypothetical protein
MPKSLYFLMCLGLFAPMIAAADCMYFDLECELSKVPFIIKGTVHDSNEKEYTSSYYSNGANAKGDNSTHKFEISVERVLKGSVPFANLLVEYKPNLDIICPAQETFANGARQIFFLSSVSKRGGATLFGFSCGRDGVKLSDSKAIAHIEAHLKEKAPSKRCIERRALLEDALRSARAEDSKATEPTQGLTAQQERGPTP